MKETFDVLRYLYYNRYANITLRHVHRPQLKPLETLRKRGKLKPRLTQNTRKNLEFLTD